MTPPPSFDAIAPYYQLLEGVTFGPLLQRCRTAFLDRMRNSSRALILGDGDGRFLAELLRSNPDIEVDSLDLSDGMISLARRRVAPSMARRVRFATGDARSVAFPSTGYDLVVTNFFLDCFPANEMGPLIDRIAAVSGPGALWVDGDFRLPSKGWLRILAKVLLVGMYGSFRVLTGLRSRALIDPAPFIRRHGFGLVEEKEQLWGFLSSRLWASSLVPHSVGVTPPYGSVEAKSPL